MQTPKAEDTTPALNGIEYLLTKPDFQAASKEAMPSDSRDREGIVITFGGADSFGGTGQCIASLLAFYDINGENVPRLTVLASDKMAEAQDIDELLTKWPGEAKRVPWMQAHDVAALFGACHTALVSHASCCHKAL